MVASSDNDIAAKKAQLAELRAQVRQLEAELSGDAAAAPAEVNESGGPLNAAPLPAAPPAPPFEHTEYHHYTGNLGPEGLGWQRPPDEAALSTEQLKETRAYARDVEVQSVEEVIAGCSDSLRRYGFCVVDHVVPRDMVDAVCHELSEGQQAKIAAMSPEEMQRPGPDGRPRPMAFLGPTLQPLYSQYVCHPAVVGIAQTILDNHVRIAHRAGRNVPSDDQAADGARGGYGRAENRGPLGREWHTVRPMPLFAAAHAAAHAPLRWLVRRTGRTTCTRATTSLSANRSPTCACA